MAGKNIKEEVANLASRNPRRGISSDLPAVIRRAMAEKEAAEMQGQMGRAYDAAMPSPQRYAGGGMVRGDGCAIRGKTRGTVR